MKYKDWDIDSSGFTWKLKFLDIESENFGLTFPDLKEIHIYYKGRSKQVVMDTVIHELEHMLMFDLADAIFLHDVEKVAAKEENLVRVINPRRVQFLRDNKELMKWILSQL